jgi:LAO/AO transport system kinase
MANRGALGGLSEATLQAALLMDASGKDDVFLETVGVGQAEVDIIDHADTVVLVLIPGSGDSVQALKAGVMEIPDIIVVNKSDHPLTDTMIREIRGVLSLAPAARLARADRQDRGRPRAGRRRAHRADGGHRAHLEQEGMLAERRRRNLRNEILASARTACAAGSEEALEEDPEFAPAARRGRRRETDPASGRHHAARARRRCRGRAADRA